MKSNICNTKGIIRIIIIGIITVFMVVPSELISQETQIVISAMRKVGDQEEVITYQSIKESEIVDFSNLIRVYINKASVVVKVDDSLVLFNKTGDKIKRKLITNIENKYGKITPENIKNSKCDLVLLVRKSVFTNKSDFAALLEMINTTVFDLMEYYSQGVYKVDYDLLNTQQKSYIRNLVPLNNYLADDVKM